MNECDECDGFPLDFSYRKKIMKILVNETLY